MRIIASLVLLILFTGCNAVSDSSNSLKYSQKTEAPSRFFWIEGKAPKQSIHPTVENGVLKLENLTVKNWPGIDLKCRQCDIEKGLKAFFNGSTQWLSIFGEKHSTLLITSFQYRDFISPWHFSYHDEYLTIQNRKARVEAKVAYDASLPQAIANSGCNLVWLKRQAQDQPPEGISNDVAEFKTQLIIQCEI